jgi:hypothetical protein
MKPISWMLSIAALDWRVISIKVPDRFNILLSPFPLYVVMRIDFQKRNDIILMRVYQQDIVVQMTLPDALPAITFQGMIFHVIGKPARRFFALIFVEYSYGCFDVRIGLCKISIRFPESPGGNEPDRLIARAGH